ncbi:hypothetical protein MMC16_005685 [Acarospora aff. strigata]|nr:hypothetical protein [Acarospora aff. strigata]
MEMNYNKTALHELENELSRHSSVLGNSAAARIRPFPWLCLFDRELTLCLPVVHNIELNDFDYIHQSPEGTKAFNDFMGVICSGRKFWADWFPVDAEILADFFAAADDVLLADVGGGNGHDLESFLTQFPQAEGPLVLQDLPGTISNLKVLNKGIRAMPHDFSTPQPVKGQSHGARFDPGLLFTTPPDARVYYSHFVLHDWPDEKCRIILRNLMSAMKPG